jgi:hypothetical protein
VFLGTKGNNEGLEGLEFSLSINATNLTGRGVVKLGEGKSAEKLPKFKLLETPTEGVTGK